MTLRNNILTQTKAEVIENKTSFQVVLYQFVAVAHL